MVPRDVRKWSLVAVRSIAVLGGAERSFRNLLRKVRFRVKAKYRCTSAMRRVAAEARSPSRGQLSRRSRLKPASPFPTSTATFRPTPILF